MKYLQYKGVVEREYKMSLKKIMYQLCVIENINAVEGAKKLGIAKEIFVYWRRHFRFENRQLLFDQTIDDLTNLQHDHKGRTGKSQLRSLSATPPSDTIDELEDVVSELISYYSYIDYVSEGLSLHSAKLPLYEFSKSVIADYRNGELTKGLRDE